MRLFLEATQLASKELPTNVFRTRVMDFKPAKLLSLSAERKNHVIASPIFVWERQEIVG